MTPWIPQNTRFQNPMEAKQNGTQDSCPARGSGHLPSVIQEAALWMNNDNIWHLCNSGHFPSVSIPILWFNEWAVRHKSPHLTEKGTETQRAWCLTILLQPQGSLRGKGFHPPGFTDEEIEAQGPQEPTALNAECLCPNLWAIKLTSSRVLPAGI